MKPNSFTLSSFSGVVLLGLFLTQLAVAQITPPGGGGGCTNCPPPTNSYDPPDYGSNLWIRVDGIFTNTLTGIISNTEPDIQYEVQSIPDLTLANNPTNWLSDGFILGSEVTNWTALAINLSGLTNEDMFFRIRSWIDTYDMGIPDWWQLQYFGYVGIDPYGDPAGDGYSNLYKYQHGLNPFVFYQPQFPVVSAAPTTSDNGSTVSWDPAQGQVLSYTIYRNGSPIATVSSNQFSYTDTSTPLNLTDPTDADFPTYQIEVNYNGASYLGGSEQPFDPRFAIATEIVRGTDGQPILLVPNIPNGVTTIRVYVQVGSVAYPNDTINGIDYEVPVNYFTPTLSSNYFDVPVNDFTNSQYVIPATVLPPFGGYTISCRAIGADGKFGPDNATELNESVFIAETLNTSFVPFVDGTEQLKENLAFELEAADELGPFQFMIVGSVPPELAPDYISPTNYVSAGFYFPFDFGLPQYNSAFLDPFKPFEDNYFLRNFVYASTNVNVDGSLSSGVYYDSSQPRPIQFPQPEITTPPFLFPEYDYVTTGNTNDLQPQMSATADQWIYSPYQPGSPGQGNIGITEVGTNLFLNNGQYNIFGLEYQSAKRLYSDGVTLHTDTLNANDSIPDVGYSQFFYGQVTPPQLQTIGYFFGVPFEDYLPGMAGFNPTNTGPMFPQVLAVAEPMLMTAWAKEQIANSTSGAIGFLEQYFDKAYLADANGNIDTNEPTGILSEYGDFFATAPGKTFLVTKPAPDGQQGQLPIYTIALATDVNRDGVIDPTFGSPDFTSSAHPFRFWVNDNNDSGSMGGNDIPGYPATMDQTPNGLSGHVNGVRDLIDFFPVYIDIHDLLQVMQTNAQYAGLQFRLSQADGALNFAYTTIEPSQPESYLTDTGVAGLVASLPVTQITPSGVYLDTNFLAEIRDGNIGVILVEAWTNTSSPLLLDVMQGTNIIAEAPLYLDITGVEQMFRHKNLTADITGELAGPPDRLQDFDVPNEPDTVGDNNFIFVHGYNVNPNEARGDESAMFKRMFWSGSHAKFYGVTWDGYASQENLLGLVEFTPNYQTNVVNAFLTAPYLASFINSLSGTNTLAAHSLGNMVALSAISDWSANVQNYFMIDAAVPIEAVDGGVGVNTNMVYPDWLPYNQNLWASFWYQLWPSGDARSTLTWNDRLANFNGANVYDFYSSGENVLRTWTGGYPPSTLFGILFSQIKAYLEGQSGDYVWAWQELMKGRMDSTLNNSILSSDHGGWRFNSDYSSLTVAQADALPSSELQTNAFFDFAAASGFTADLALEGPSGSAYAAANRNRILSDAIPAVSLPIGANPVPILNATGGNIDMQTSYEVNGWPISTGAEAYNWHHSDWRVVAYLYTYGLFNDMVTFGGLK